MNYEAARQQMLSQQIRTWDVLDERVLKVLSETPREAFVPETERDLAFADTEIPLAHGQHMMPPRVEARLLQELALESTDSVLEIGTGSGYLTACLARMADTVESLEIFADLSQAAAEKLNRAGIDNIRLRDEDAMQAEYSGQYDAIALTASLPAVDERFLKMLAVGGRMFMVIGQAPAMEAVLILKHADGSYSQKSLFETVLDPMINAKQPAAFVL